MVTGLRYYWRRYLGWFPVQFCVVCGKAYWGGFPRFYWGPPRGWYCAWMNDYCSKVCCDYDLDILDKMYG